jgi:hypothetical protein
MNEYKEKLANQINKVRFLDIYSVFFLYNGAQNPPIGTWVGSSH